MFECHYQMYINFAICERFRSAQSLCLQTFIYNFKVLSIWGSAVSLISFGHAHKDKFVNGIRIHRLSKRSLKFDSSDYTQQCRTLQELNFRHFQNGTRLLER